MSPIFSIIGDSNVSRNITKTNTRACPQMASSQFLFCQKLPLLEDALGKIRKESTVCIVACVTNFLTASDDDSMVSKRIEPVLDEFVHHLSAACTSAPDLSILVSPPMYRKSPLWYCDGLPEVLTSFSGAFRGKPSNLHLLPSFSTPDYEGDGVHLTAYSGLEYMIHLFDSSMSYLDMLSRDCDERHPVATEVTRLLEDRVIMLEQDHRRLNKDVEMKAAVDAELHDYHENVANEAFLMVTGCPRILGLSPKEWQERAKKDLAPVLKELMGRPIPIEYISNATGPRPDAPVRYNVKLFSTEVSKEVRTKFGKFYVNGRDERPQFFKPYSIRNLITQSSRIRIAILQVIARRYRSANQGSHTKVINYDPRPILRITPTATGSRTRSYNFIEAICKYPTNFNKDDLKFIFSKVGYKQKGQLKSLFVCISDDMLPKKHFRPRNTEPEAAADVTNGANSSETDSEMETDQEATGSNPTPVPPPPAPVVPQPTGSRSQPSGSKPGRASHKRGASVPAGSQEKSSRT